jgi:hypothetical protein
MGPERILIRRFSRCVGDIAERSIRIPGEQPRLTVNKASTAVPILLEAVVQAKNWDSEEWRLPGCYAMWLS